MLTEEASAKLDNKKELTISELMVSEVGDSDDDRGMMTKSL